MGEWLEALILGIVQGITEFLPISSSGHLEIAKYLLNDDSLAQNSLLMTITLHAATALSTVYVYFKDIKDITSDLFRWDKKAVQFCTFIALSIIPAAIVGLVFEKEIELLFNKNMTLVSMMLTITGMLLLFAHYAKSYTRNMIWIDSIIIGISQAIAILPGISRSGATISAALILGIDKEKATRFSFLMVIPLIIGKMCKELIDGDFSNSSLDLLSLFIGFMAAFITGIIACKWIIKIVKNAKLYYFAVYCFIVAFLLWII